MGRGCGTARPESGVQRPPGAPSGRVRPSRVEPAATQHDPAGPGPAISTPSVRSSSVSRRRRSARFPTSSEPTSCWRPKTQAALNVAAVIASAGFNRHFRQANAMANAKDGEGAEPGLKLLATATAPPRSINSRPRHIDRQVRIRLKGAGLRSCRSQRERPGLRASWLRGDQRCGHRVRLPAESCPGS